MRKLLFALLLSLPLGLLAQQKIAVVNTAEIMQNLPDIKSVETKIQDLAKKYDADLKGMQDELQKKAEAFTKEKDSLVGTIRERRQQELEDIQLRIQQSYQAMQEDMQKQQQSLMAPIQAKVMTAIKKVGDSMGCAYVMEQAAMLHVGKEALDITAKVKAELGIKK